MAHSDHKERSPVILRVYQLLPEVYRRLLSYCSPLTKAELVFKWSIEEKLAFDTLKDRITSAPILALPDNTTPYHIEADSSDFTTGAVLSQQSSEDGKWHLVTFLSKSLSPVEWNYEIHNKEMLAIV